MSDAALQSKIALMHQLYSRRLRVTGTLAQQVNKANRRLPRKLRADARSVVEVLPLLDHPKLSRQVDFVAADAAASRVIAHLQKVDPRDRMWVKLVQLSAWVLLAVVTAGFAYGLYLRFLG